MDAAGLRPYERVEVNGIYCKDRIVTYILEGERGSGRCELNGGAANFFAIGDKVHVNCYAFIEEKEQPRKPKIVITGERNEIIR